MNQDERQATLAKVEELLAASERLVSDARMITGDAFDIYVHGAYSNLLVASCILKSLLPEGDNDESTAT